MPVRYYDKSGNRVLNKENLATAMANIKKTNYWDTEIAKRKAWLKDPDSFSKDVYLSEWYIYLDRAVTKLVKLGALNHV